MKNAQGPLLSLFQTDGSSPLQQQLFDRLRGAILDGAFHCGDRLPSTRTLARDLGVSRNTVVAAIDRLVAEGYLETRVGSGTYVTRRLPDDAMTPALRVAASSTRPGPTIADSAPRGAIIGDTLPFRAGLPAVDQFDLDVWKRLIMRRWRDAGPSVLGRDAGGGWLPLRRVLAAHLQAARGLRCDPEQILVLPSRTAGLEVAASLIVAAGDRVWLEDPGCPTQRAVILVRACHPAFIPVDGEGFDPDRAQRLCPDARMAVVTPGWQFPAGGTMPMRRRLALLSWARRSGGWVLEDDADGGYTYDGRPLPALQGLDEGGRVIHLGSFDRVLVPAVRLAWLVVPPELLGAAQDLRCRLGATVPLPEQMAIHDLIAEGHLASHLRRTRRVYAARRDALRSAAERYWTEALTLEEAGAGLHLTARTTPALGLSAAEVAVLAAARGIELQALEGFEAGRHDRTGLILGYAACTEEKILRAAERLAMALDRPTAARGRSGSAIAG
ncbi:MAG: hypothetical protein RLY86_3096 [Pseudomonadota bacterium]|jgi:GntR family transcriptional regulator/MocR family aminotransferase